jgi:hypothetical protein
MTGSSSVRISRSGRYIVAIVALVLALGGLSISPASANQRGTAVNEANNSISACFKADGNPWHVVASDRHINVLCEYDDGILNCHWWADDGWAADCYWTPNSVVGNPDDRANGDGTVLPARVSAVAPGEVTVVSDGARTTSNLERSVEHKQKARGKGKHGKQHGKGKHKGGNRR